MIIPNYTNIQKQNQKFISERMEFLKLSKILKNLKQMDNLVRHSLGSDLDLNEYIAVSDSSKDGYNFPEMNFSNIQNVPSQAPITGFISQKSSDVGLFLKNKHLGIDIVAKEGAPFVAAAKGLVVFAGWTEEFGNTIILYHGNDYFTHYGHSKQNLKKQLDVVDRGEVIGLVGSTGVSSGPHLHFEVWHEFKPVDPLSFFPEYKLKNVSLIDE